jgi:Putative zinc-finger
MTPDATTRPTGHDDLRRLIPAYVSALALGTVDPTEHTPLIAHLRSCAACREEVAELVSLLREAASCELPAVPTYPSFKLDFLRGAGPAPDRPWLVDDVGRLVISFSATLLDQLRPMVAGGMARSQGALTPRYQYEQRSFEQGDARQALPVVATFFGAGPNPTTLELVVHVPLPGRRPSQLAGSGVTLRGPQGEVALVTDRFGDATFSALPVADLPHIQLLISAP